MRRALPYAALVGAAALFGGSFVVIKAAVESLPPLAFVGWRFLIAALLLLGLGLPRGRQIWRDGVAAGLMLFLGFAFQTAGLVTTTASKSGLITGLYVVLTPLIAGVAARRAPKTIALLGTGLAFAGLALLMTPDGGFSGLVVGDPLTVGAALGFAGHIVVLAKSAPRHPVISFTAVQMSVVAALALISSLVVEGLPIPTVSDLPALAATGIAISGGAFLMQIWAQTKIGPTHTAVVLALEPFFAAVTGMVVLGERLNGRGWAGAAAILAAIYLVVFGTSEELSVAESIRQA